MTHPGHTASQRQPVAATLLTLAPELPTRQPCPMGSAGLPPNPGGNVGQGTRLSCMNRTHRASSDGAICFYFWAQIMR